jgi:ABC-2 type transport system permease protein
LVILPDFSRQLTEDGTAAEVQVLIDGVDANTAGIANGYISQIIQQYNKQLIKEQNSTLIEPQTIFFYNQGLISSWFFVPGAMGLVCTLVSSLVSAGTVIREKDTGTLEQLLMTPAQVWEILLAKIVPLFVFLLGSVTIALLITRVIFNVPFRGNLLLFYLLSTLYIFVGIGIGMMLATITRTQTQAFLTSFFVNLPLIQLSGAIAPVESMPDFMRCLSLFDPLTHYVAIIRSIMLRGVGLEVLWQNALALLGFAIIILSISINRFRRQLV